MQVIASGHAPAWHTSTQCVDGKSSQYPSRHVSPATQSVSTVHAKYDDFGLIAHTPVADPVAPEGHSEAGPHGGKHTALGGSRPIIAGTSPPGHPFASGCG